MKAILDRIENGYAVVILCDRQETRIQLPLFLLSGQREGDVFELTITRDDAATRIAREKTRKLIGDLDR